MFFIRNELKIKRIEANIKQIQLAKMLGISTTRLSLIENGHCDCDEVLLSSINQILDNK